VKFVDPIGVSCTCKHYLNRENQDSTAADDGAAGLQQRWESTFVNTPTVAEVLKNLRFSESLPPQVLEAIASSATLRDFPAGTMLFREGTQNDSLMILATGSVALDVYVPGRGDVRILSLGPGDMVAWSALLGGGRMTTSAIALQDTRLIAIPGAEAIALCESDPTFGYNLMRQVAAALANRLVATRLQLLDLFAETAPVIPQEPD
jgi:CRP/FNR family cyclic AMP-dependent transcriptional regulator